MNIILLGPPGAGKGTQADSIKEKFSLAHVSTGDILRASVQAGKPLGLEAKSYMEKGELVPDKVVIGIIEDRLQDEDTIPGYMLDGFPRTNAQADALEKMLVDLTEKSGKSRSIDHVIYLEVPEHELIQRLQQRSAKQGRADDNDETVKNRISVYFEQTSPLIDYYEAKGLLRRINGLGDIDRITQDIFQILNN